MLSRAVVASARQRGVYSRSLSSSCRSLKGITMGGDPSDFDFDGFGDFVTQGQAKPFAFLQKEAEKAKSKEPSLKQEKTGTQVEEVPFVSKSSPSVSSTPSTSTRSGQSNQPDFFQARAVSEETGRRRNPFDIRAPRREEPVQSPLKEESEVQSGGWAPGLQEKIANAQEKEQQTAGGEGSHTIMTDSIVEEKPSRHGSASKKSSDARLNSYEGVVGRPCNDIFGFEKWSIFSKREKSPGGGWRHLFLRRYRVKQEAALALFSSVSSAIATTKAVPRCLSLENYDGYQEFKGETRIRVELGGWYSSDLPSSYNCPRFPEHQGLSSADGYAILHIESILKMHEELEKKGIRTDVDQLPMSRTQAVSSRSPNETVTNSQQARSKPPLRESRSVFNTMSTASRASDPIDLSSGGGAISQERKAPPRQEAAPKRQQESRRKQRDLPRQQDRQSKDSKWSTMYGRDYGVKQSKSDTSVPASKLLLDTIVSNVPNKVQSMMTGARGAQSADKQANDPWHWSTARVEAKETSDSAFISTKDAEKDSVSSEVPRIHAVENSTPVAVDGEQAKSAVTTSATIKEIQEADPRQMAPGVEKRPSVATSGSNPVEGSTPVFIDGNQANDSKNDQSVDEARHQQEGLRSDNSQSTATSDDGGIEEATPVLIDGEQASETAITTEDSSDKLGGPEIRKKTPVEQPKSVHDVNGEQSSDSIAGIQSKNKHETSSADPVSSIEESTPVRVDDEQAKGTAPTTTESEADQSSTSQESVPSSDNRVDESTPVAVEGEQMGKQ